MKKFLFFFVVNREEKASKEGEANKRNVQQKPKNEKIKYYIETRNENCHHLDEDAFEYMSKNCPKNFIMVLFLIKENHEKIFASSFNQVISKWVFRLFINSYFNQFHLYFVASKTITFYTSIFSTIQFVSPLRFSVILKHKLKNALQQQIYARSELISVKIISHISNQNAQLTQLVTRT